MQSDLIQSKFGGEALTMTHEDNVRVMTEKVLAREIPWEGYQRAELITPVELELIKKYDKATEESRMTIIEQEGELYLEIFLDFLTKLNQEATLQYLLALIEQLLTIQPNAIQLFFLLSKKKPTFPFEPFLKLLNRANVDWFVHAKASRILGTLISSAPSVPKEVMESLSLWCNGKIRKGEDTDVAISLTTLQRSLRRNDFRLIYATKESLFLLGELLVTRIKNIQLLYQTIYCIWQLSYNKEVGERINDSKIIPRLVDTLKVVTKDKVVRLDLATLVNLLGLLNNNEMMIDAGIFKYFDIISAKQRGDEDLLQDLKTLEETLQKNMVILSTFDMYKKELMSGRLEWTPVHRSEKFWRENAPKLEEDNYKLLLQLKELLTSSPEPSVVAIACHDAGEFAKFHPRGKIILQQLNIKIHLMKLMEDKDPEVRKQALLAVQKYFSYDYSVQS